MTMPIPLPVPLPLLPMYFWLICGQSGRTLSGTNEMD
jgi:hypothetical protein